jgi:uncharacterized protein YbaA (DUF1428 family)
MAGYVDVYALSVPRKNLAAYTKLAKTFAKVVKDHGVLEYREFVSAGEKPMKGVKPFDVLVKPKRGEVVVTSLVGFRNKAHRDRVNKAVFADPRMQAMMKQKPVFDMKRMYVGEFETFVEV